VDVNSTQILFYQDPKYVNPTPL